MKCLGETSSSERGYGTPDRKGPAYGADVPDGLPEAGLGLSISCVLIPAVALEHGHLGRRALCLSSDGAQVS
jgi:hypothetical protein